MSIAYNPRIITDGLVFYVDAGNRRSYPGNGNNCINLINQSINSGIFTNGSTYGYINGGSFIFDGVNDYINVSNPERLNPGSGSFTLDFWCFVSSDVPTTGSSCLIEARGNGLHGFLAVAYRNNGQMQLFLNGNQDSTQNIYATTNNPVQRNQWIYEAFTVDRNTQQITFYYNGIQAGNRVNITDTASIDPTGGGYVYWIGGDKGGNEMNGYIAIVRQYNKCLTSEEIKQNFNANRRRFGL